MSTLPERIGKYPVTGVLGEGAMGVVYRAVDPVIERVVAIKTVKRALLDADDAGASFAARFRHEARSAGRLAHPGIVAVYEYGEEGDAAWLVMEYVEGRTLAQRLGAGPAPELPEILALMEQLLDALGHAHAQGVWHRDIKPANLILTREGRLKIADFGIARLAEVALTQTCASIGTPGYMAPEQYTGLGLDHRADLFAAGALLYRLLTGRPAFVGAPDAVMYQVLHENPLPPSRHGAAPAFDAVLARALARDPAARFPDAAALRDALREAAGRLDDLPTRVLGVPPAGCSLGDQERTALEQALASAIGPVAKVLLRQAAQTATDRATLIHGLAGQIGEPTRRAAFLARVGAAPVAGPATSAAPAATAAPGGALDAATLDHATRVLTTQIGPIAKVLVRQAASRARSTEQFYALLAQGTGAGPGTALLQQLRRPG
ncbi:serine/threonine-protein kinase [Piscinibacter defluvii]|uniref:serine/threonine-protein kinase n=1 Tax=Piscinibacter defluvii TaxID=1796922 RepID=UPI000FDE31D7|nr:serine/threonine-protein kinase [Piscinibacter defluvii]